MIWIKEHMVNKIPIIVSVSKFEIMRSGLQAITVISSSGYEVMERVRWIISDLIEKVLVSFFY